MTRVTKTTQAGALEQIVRWTAQEEKYRKAKERAIRKAHAAGFSTRELGIAAGVSHMSIQRLLERPVPGRKEKGKR